MSDVLTEAVERFMDAVEERLRSMDARITEVQGRAAEPGPAGPQGEQGPQGDPGERGADGAAADPEALRAAVREALRGEVREAVTEHMRSFYRGVYAEGGEYRAGQAVTHDGSLWIATRDNPAKPGEDGWQLAVKRGRDAARR